MRDHLYGDRKMDFHLTKMESMNDRVIILEEEAIIDSMEDRGDSTGGSPMTVLTGA